MAYDVQCCQNGIARAPHMLSVRGVTLYMIIAWLWYLHTMVWICPNWHLEWEFSLSKLKEYYPPYQCICDLFVHEKLSKIISLIKQSKSMGLNNHTLKIFENNRNVDPLRHGCHHFRICALWGILVRIFLWGILGTSCWNSGSIQTWIFFFIFPFSTSKRWVKKEIIKMCRSAYFS